MKIREINAKTCMVKSKLSDYVINPYVGCGHGCKYCYAVFMKKFYNIKENWGDFCFVKVNCPELLKRELATNPSSRIWLSSVTDPYCPIERKYKLTRRILETILKSGYRNKFTIEILTKSSLIRRDFDLLRKLNVEIGCSINTLNNEISKVLEPFASLPLERIKFLREAKKQGIKVYAFISPVFIGITDLEELFKELSFCDYVWVELLNIKKSVLNRLIPVIRRSFPDKIKDFEFMINNYDKYCDKIKREVRGLEKKYRLKVRDIVVH